MSVENPLLFFTTPHGPTHITDARMSTPRRSKPCSVMMMIKRFHTLHHSYVTQFRDAWVPHTQSQGYGIRYTGDDDIIIVLQCERPLVVSVT